MGDGQQRHKVGHKTPAECVVASASCGVCRAAALRYVAHGEVHMVWVMFRPWYFFLNYEIICLQNQLSVMETLHCLPLSQRDLIVSCKKDCAFTHCNVHAPEHASALLLGQKGCSCPWEGQGRTMERKQNMSP